MVRSARPFIYPSNPLRDMWDWQRDMRGRKHSVLEKSLSTSHCSDSLWMARRHADG